MPNALVRDILELGNSKVRQTLKDEYFLDALLHTWGALADVYGRAATLADREVAGLLLLDQAGHALIMAQGMGYPGAETLLRKYWLETELLDLSQIHKGTPDFKNVGKRFEYIKRHRKDLPKRPTPVPGPQQQQCTKPTSAQRKTATLSANQRADTSTPARTRIDSRLCRPAAGLGVTPLNLIDGLFGNWRDHWDNTLP